MSNIKHVNFRSRGPARRAGPVILGTVAAVVCFWIGIYVGWMWRGGQPVAKIAMAPMMQLHDYMKDGTVRAAWRSVYCDKETELILSSPLRQEEMK